MSTFGRGGKHALLAIDPGGTTGVAACHVEMEGTVKDTLLGATMKKSTEVKGNWFEQGQELARIMNQFSYVAMAEHQLPDANIHIVIEDFILRRKRQGGATGILDSIWVAACALGSFGFEIPAENWQQPSDLKSFATKDRQRMWGIYEPGSPHRQDAWGHIAVKVDRLLG